MIGHLTHTQKKNYGKTMYSLISARWIYIRFSDLGKNGHNHVLIFSPPWTPILRTVLVKKSTGNSFTPMIQFYYKNQKGVFHSKWPLKYWTLLLQQFEQFIVGVFLDIVRYFSYTEAKMRIATHTPTEHQWINRTNIPDFWKRHTTTKLMIIQMNGNIIN